tara:strand:- start:2274 stop:2582 length:309 start_codon:yes stop_codon:yes gene_type:complete
MAIETTINVATGEITTATYEAPGIPDSAYWSKLRSKRNRLIAETDWEIVRHKELETNVPASLKTYRQELRDLPANTTDPAKPTWPLRIDLEDKVEALENPAE